MYYKLGFMAHHNTFSFPFLLHRQRKGKTLRIAKKTDKIKKLMSEKTSKVINDLI